MFPQNKSTDFSWNTKQTTPTAKVRLAAKYPNTDIDWKGVYSLAFRSTLESKLREFQFKILNRIVFTNEKLFCFGMPDSPTCAFCQTEVESLGHLLFSCKVSSKFWKHVLSWLRDYNIFVENIKEEDIIFGKFDIADDFFLFNHILLLGKFYIYSQKCRIPEEDTTRWTRIKPQQNTFNNPTWPACFYAPLHHVGQHEIYICALHVDLHETSYIPFLLHKTRRQI